jgi:hypothetical protein
MECLPNTPYTCALLALRRQIEQTLTAQSAHVQHLMDAYGG